MQKKDFEVSIGNRFVGLQNMVGRGKTADHSSLVYDNIYLEYQELNQPLKQKELNIFFKKYNIDFVGCLETRVKQFKAQSILSKIVQGWNTWCNHPME